MYPGLEAWTLRLMGGRGRKYMKRSGREIWKQSRMHPRGDGPSMPQYFNISCLKLDSASQKSPR